VVPDPDPKRIIPDPQHWVNVKIKINCSKEEKGRTYVFLLTGLPVCMWGGGYILGSSLPFAPAGRSE